MYERMTLEEATYCYKNFKTDKTLHIIDNGDNTFSIISHIAYKMCDYCNGDDGPFPYKKDIYEEHNKAIAMWENESMV